ncbi:FAD-binding protein [Shigella flexneri]
MAGGITLYNCCRTSKSRRYNRTDLKSVPMRSHTVAAEGGSAAVAQDHDSFDYHFHDKVAGGTGCSRRMSWITFFHHCPTEMTQLEQWGCPWSRREDGSVNVRRFGGMKIERT